MEGTDVSIKKYSDIDNFVNNLSSESRRKTLKVIRVIFDKANLTGSSTIEIPFQELSKNKVSDSEAIDILKNLHKNGIAETVLTDIEIKGVNGKPGIGIIKTITEDKSIFNSRAKIYIRENKLKYLKRLLDKNRLNLGEDILQKISIPKDKTFSDVEIRFQDDNFFEVKIGTKTERLHGSDLGLLKTKNGKFTEKKCLNLLTLLSLSGGVYPLQNHTNKQREEKTSRKRELKNALQRAFGTKEDPFLKYNDDSIRIKIKLIPLKSLRGFEYRDRRMSDSEKFLTEDSPFS